MIHKSIGGRWKMPVVKSATSPATMLKKKNCWVYKNTSKYLNSSKVASFFFNISILKSTVGTLVTCHVNVLNHYWNRTTRKAASLSESHRQKVSTHSRSTPKSRNRTSNIITLSRMRAASSISARSTAVKQFPTWSTTIAITLAALRVAWRFLRVIAQCHQLPVCRTISGKFIRASCAFSRNLDRDSLVSCVGQNGVVPSTLPSRWWKSAQCLKTISLKKRKWWRNFSTRTWCSCTAFAVSTDRFISSLNTWSTGRCWTTCDDMNSRSLETWDCC